MVEFGETVLAKLAIQRIKKGVKDKQKRKLADRSVEGILVGIMPRTGEHIVIKASGDAVRCRTVRRVPEEDRWNASKVLAIGATPRCPAPNSKQPEEIQAKFVDENAMDKTGHAKEKKSAEDNAAAGPDKDTGKDLEEPRARHCDVDVRELRITEAVLEKYGYSEHCKGCEHK